MAPKAIASGTTTKPTSVATFAASSKGLPGNSFIMPVLMRYGCEDFTTENLLLDSGAECCVCPREYIHYKFPEGRWMVVRYLVFVTPFRC